jgi:hypothetical protein
MMMKSVSEMMMIENNKVRPLLIEGFFILHDIYNKRKLL